MRGPEPRPRKRAIAVIIEAPAGDDGPAGPGALAAGKGPGTQGAEASPRWLLVQRPLDDEDLPGTWGLPAGSLAPGETGDALVRRIGHEKLGVELRPGRALTSGRTERPGYALDMTLWAASIESGTVEVPRTATGVTQYRNWRWGPPAALAAGAGEGSLCCRLGLEWVARPA